MLNVDLKSIIDQMKDILSDHYSMMIRWVSRAQATSNHYDIQILALALQSLSDEKFREIAIPEIMEDNECCGDRAIMSINKFYVLWRFFSVDRLCNSNADHSTDNNNDANFFQEKLEVLIAGSKTIALRMAVADGLRFQDTVETAEVFLYAEIKLQKKLKLLTLATSMLHNNIGNCMSLTKLEKITDATYLKIAAEHSLLDKLLDANTKSQIANVRDLYDELLHVHIENSAQKIKDSQYLCMIKHYGKMIHEEITTIKMNWLKSKLA